MTIQQIRPTARDSPSERWWDEVPWWTDAGLAYVKGLIDGRAMSCPDCDHFDDQQHRETVRRIIRVIDQADHRRRSDRGELQEGRQAA